MALNRVFRILCKSVAMGICALFVSGFCSACAYAPEINTKKLEKPNPTSFVFSASFPEVLAELDKLCETNRSPKETDPPTSKAVYECVRSEELYQAVMRGYPRPKTYYTPNYQPMADSDQIVLTTKPFGSRTYYAEAKPLHVMCNLRLSITRIDTRKTKVSISAEQLKARNGTMTGMHGATVPNIERLEPTSIEEYEILIYLGDRLGENNMPTIQFQ